MSILSDQDGEMLLVALEQARTGGSEGGIPIGAALYVTGGELLGAGRNRRVQDGDPTSHGETDAFRAAGRRPTYNDTTLITTLFPCRYCTGMILQFGIPRVIVGDCRTVDTDHLELLVEAGVEVIDAASEECFQMIQEWIPNNQDLFYEDGGRTRG